LNRAADLGELVDLRVERRRQRSATHHAIFDQRVQTSSQQGGADIVEPRFKIAEAQRSEQQFADDEQRPTLSNDFRRPRERAELRVTCSAHLVEMAEAAIEVNLTPPRALIASSSPLLQRPRWCRAQDADIAAPARRRPPGSPRRS